MMYKYGQKCTEQIKTQAQKCLGESTKIDKVVIKRQPRCYHISYTALIFLIIGLIVVILCRRFVKDLLEWLQNLDEWARVFLFVIMFTVVSFPMTWGYILLNVAAGYLYGFLLGFFIVIISVLCGLGTAFIVCRRCLRDFVRSKLESDNLKAIMRVVEGKRGFKVIALTRLTPVPFGLQNGLFAVRSHPLSVMARSTVCNISRLIIFSVYKVYYYGHELCWVRTCFYNVRATNNFFSFERTCFLLSHCFGWTKQKCGRTQKNEKSKIEKRGIQINILPFRKIYDILYL